MAQSHQSPAGSRVDMWITRINRVPRLGRVVLSLLITLELVILLSVIIDRTLIDAVVEGDVDPMTPALIAAVLGVVIYGISWWALVGFDADPGDPWQAGLPAVVMVGAGIAGLVLIVVLALFGLAFGYVL